MTPSFLIKLCGLLLVSWVTFGAGPLSAQPVGMLCGLLVLMAFLDAGQAAQALGTAKDGAVEIGVFFGRLVSLSGAPFYVALMVFAFVGMSGKGAGTGSAVRAAVASASMCGAEGGGCGSSGGGCGTGGCGASGGGACGCSGGSKKTSKSTASSSPKAVPKKLTEAELKQRAEMVQQRAMTTAPAGSTNLPGIGPNGRALPPGLVPKPGVALPPGVVPTAPATERGVPTPQQVASPISSSQPKDAASPAPPAAGSETRASAVVPTTPADATSPSAPTR